MIILVVYPIHIALKIRGFALFWENLNVLK